jgi:hypothetical protein
MKRAEPARLWNVNLSLNRLTFFSYKATCLHNS